MGRDTLAPMFMDKHISRVTVFISAVQSLFLQLNVVDTHSVRLVSKALLKPHIILVLA